MSIAYRLYTPNSALALRQELGYVFRRARNGMITATEIIHEAESLPVEQRVLVLDALLRTLNPPDPEIDRRWTTVAKRRLEELRTGKVKAIPGEEVFEKIRSRFP